MDGPEDSRAPADGPRPAGSGPTGGGPTGGGPTDGGSTLRAVTFDVTHTLIHAPRLAAIYREVMARHGLLERFASEDEAEEAIRGTIPVAWQELACRGGPKQDRFATFEDGAEGFWHRFLERLSAHLELPAPSRFASAEIYQRFAQGDSWEIYADVPPALRELRRLGLRLGVVSNWDHRLPGLLDDLGLAQSFDAVVYSAELGLEKPHPGIFRACLAELGVAPEEALHVGDRKIEDAEGAEALGMAFVLLGERAEENLLDRLAPHLPDEPIEDPAPRGLHLVD